MNEKDYQDLHDQLEEWSEAERAAVTVAKSIASFRNELMSNGVDQQDALILSAEFLKECMIMGRGN